MNMQKKLIVLMAAMSMVACGKVMAADRPAQKAPEKMAAVTTAPDSKKMQMERLGALRGRLTATLEETRVAVDLNANGGNATYRAIQDIKQKVERDLAKPYQEENAKPQEMRDQALIDTLNRKGQKNNDMWNDFEREAWQPFTRLIGEPGQVWEALRQIFGNVASQETAWHNSGMSLDLLVGVLSGIEKRAEEVKAKADLLMSDFNDKANMAGWEAFAEE
jgi:hypothetical protein